MKSTKIQGPRDPWVTMDRGSSKTLPQTPVEEADIFRLRGEKLPQAIGRLETVQVEAQRQASFGGVQLNGP